MYRALAEACFVFFCVVAPALLTIRYVWPRILPRWGVLLAAAAIGGAAFYAREMLEQAEMMETVRRFGAFEFPAPISGDEMVSLQRPRASDFMLGAVLQLVYLLLWLVPYGILRIVLTRRGQAREGSAALTSGS